MMFSTTIQMTRFGTNFDYKVAYRDAWLYCTIIILTMTVLLISLYFPPNEDSSRVHTLYGVFHFFTSTYHQNQFLTAPFLAYIYIMRNLQKRYAVLNQLLRYAHHFSKNYFRSEFHHFFAHSKRIFDGNGVDRSIYTDQKSTIETIKFTGKYHGHLTKIMDLLNFCCSFQV